MIILSNRLLQMRNTPSAVQGQRERFDADHQQVSILPAKRPRIVNLFTMLALCNLGEFIIANN